MGILPHCRDAVSVFYSPSRWGNKSQSEHQRKWMNRQILEPCQRTRKAVEYDGDTNSSWRTWNSSQRLWKETGELGKKKSKPQDLFLNCGKLVVYNPITGWLRPAGIHKEKSKQYTGDCHNQNVRQTLDSCFNLVRSNQQCIPWSPSLEIKPVTTELKLYHWATGPHHTQALPN